MEQQKECYRCKKNCPINSFTKRIDDRFYDMCKKCVSEILSIKAKGKKKLYHSSSKRTCYLCLRFMGNECFTQRSNGTFFSACKECNLHVFSARRRARKYSAQTKGSHTTEEWQNLVSKHNKCPICLRDWQKIPPRKDGTIITVDHIIPISKGGSDSIDNLQPLCYSCN